MKSKALIPLALGLVIGLVALKLGVDTVRKAKGTQTATREIDVVVATVDIGPTLQITPEMVVVKRTVPTPLLPRDAFTKTEEVVKRVSAKMIPAGTPLAASLLAPDGTLPGLQVKIQEGYRAVSVKIDEVTGVAYQLLPGTFVDVLVVMEVNRARQRETISRVILQNIQVAAVGQVLGKPGEETGSAHAKSATLLVLAEDVAKLHLAQTKGRITLAMRGGEDEMITSESNALESELVGGPAAKATPETPAAGAPAPGTGASGTTVPPAALASALLADAPPVHPPFTTTVINGPLGSDAAGQVLRITYKDISSMEVVEVSKGRTTGDANSMQFGSGEATAGEQRTRNLFGDRDRDLRRSGAQDAGLNPEGENGNTKETGE
jgi:pilus assembly protein CpaB